MVVGELYIGTSPVTINPKERIVGAVAAARLGNSF